MPNSIVVLSGGQDSATTLAYAAQQSTPYAAVHFEYGQRHAIEKDCAQWWADKYNIPLATLHIPALQAGDSALTHPGNINATHPTMTHLPASFVPGRNIVFLTLAAAVAMQHNAPTIYTGVCQTDGSGYPDCRQNTITALQETLRLGTDWHQLTIETPLMHLTKAETFDLANRLNVLNDIIEHTHTCYEGNHTTKHNWGYGCGTCPACRVRAKGWETYITTC